MKSKSQSILEELKKKFHVSDEVIAVKMKVSSMSVYRWRQGEYEPSYAEGKMLERILRGYRHNQGEVSHVE